MNVISWVHTHLHDIWAIFSSVVATASVIAAVTPTQKDNEFLAKLMAFIAKIGLNTNKHV